MSESTKAGLGNAKKVARLEKEVEARRQEVTHALDVLRVGAHREFSFLPRGEKWFLPSVAFGLGLALSGRSKKRPTVVSPPIDERPSRDDD